jgi:PAS domain S-box-containing protein
MSYQHLKTIYELACEAAEQHSNTHDRDLHNSYDSLVPNAPNNNAPNNAPSYPLHYLIENANDIVAVFAADGTFRYVSPSAKRILGYTLEDVAGRSAFEFVHPDDIELISATHQRALQHPGVSLPMVEYRIHRQDGSWCVLEAVTTNLIHDPSVEGIVVNCHDITRRKQAMGTLAMRERYLSALVEIEQALLAFDVDEMLYDDILEVLGQAVDVSRAHIFKMHRDCNGQWLASQQAEWCAPGITPQIHNTELQNIPMDICAPRWIEVLSRGDVVGGNVADFPDGERQILEPQDIASILVLPLLVHRELSGWIGLDQCSVVRIWDLPEIDLLSATAAAISLAQERKIAFQQVHLRVQRERLLNQISRVLSSSFDTDAILQEMVMLVGKGLEVDRAFIYILQEDQVCVIHEWRVHEQVPSMKDFHTPVANWSNLTEPDAHFYRRQAFHAPDYAALPQTPVRRQLREQMWTKSALCAPVFIHDQLFGGVVLHTTTANRTFTPDEVHLLESIADQVAIALYNTRSYEQLEHLVQERTRQLQEEKYLSEAANRAKSEFLASMSHELRTPLNAILGLSHVLLQQIFGELNPKQQEYLACIRSSGDHLLELINDILDLSKVEAGKAELLLEVVAVPDLCNSCITIMQEQAHDRGLQLNSQLDPRATTCVADKRRLRQMLLNLLSNAIKFTPSGSVTLITERLPSGTRFTVADTGIGISEEQLARLFQPFTQLDSGLNRRAEGTGLGLYLTRSLAQLHGGDVMVESIAGEGSRFMIDLPDRLEALDRHSLPQPHQMAQLPSPATTALPERYRLTPGTIARILLVEDDAESAMLLRDYLSSQNYQVEHVRDGKNWLQRVRQFSPHLVLMDVQLSSHITGVDLLLMLRQEADLVDIPVIMVTAQAMQGDQERFLEAGATDYLSKPIDITKLDALLSRCLQSSARFSQIMAN